jgi:hypothetical protein
VQNGNGSVSTVMSSTAGQRDSPTDRVRQHAEIRALNEAKRVPWRTLANAADQYTEWQVFALWLRAVLDVCEALPAEVAEEIEKRSPFLLAGVESARCNTARSLGSIVSEDVTHWAESNIFAEPRRERWLTAIRYFSSKSLLFMKAWSYWEDIHERWRDTSPEHLPSYPQWMSAICAVTRLSNPKSEAQRVLDSVRRVPETSWHQLFEAFLDLTTRCLWTEIVAGAGRAGAELVARELMARHPGFDTSVTQNSAATTSALMDWVIGHEPPFANAQVPLLALGYHIKCHPAYYARRNYAAHCRGLWGCGHFDRLPSFVEWRDAADGFFER